MPVPVDWHYDPAGYTDGNFALPGGRQLSCHVESFETPEAIARGELASFVSEPGLDVPPLSDADITGNVLMFVRSAAGDRTPCVIWKSLQVLDATYVRVARFALPFDPEKDDVPSPESGLAGDITAAINQGWFADHPTPLDRVAPTPALKRVAPWGIIHMRVPEFWRYERVEDGRFVCDVLEEHMPPDPTLWFNFDQFSTSSDELVSLAQIREDAIGLAKTLGSPDNVMVDHDSGGSWIESISHGHDGDTEVVDYLMHRLVGGYGLVTIAHFNFVLTADDARTAAGQELVGLMHNEIRNAIVLAEPPCD